MGYPLLTIDYRSSHNRLIMRRLSFFLWTVCWVVLAGCNLSQPDVIYVTATPGVPVAVVPESTATPTLNLPTFTPQPTLTPTVVPAQALGDAARLQQSGYYEDAVVTYQTVIAQGQSVLPEQRADATYGLGYSALREGLFAQAVDSLNIFIAEFSGDARTPQAYFLRGDAYLGLSRWTEAIADFQQYLTLRPGLVDSYAYERIGDAQLALGRLEPALASYNQATSASRTLVPQLQLREKVASVLLANDRTTEAVVQYDSILTVAQNEPYRASIELSAAQALLDGGQTENGLARMRMVFDTYVSTPQAYDAMQVLLANGVELDQLQQGRVSFAYGDYQSTINVLNIYTTQYVLTAVPAELHMMLGRSYREIGNPSAALVAFQTIIDQYPQDPAFGTALLEQGRTHFLSGDTSAAIAQYTKIADTYGYVPEAPEALWRVGYLYGTNGQTAESQTAFERLADEYPDSAQAKDGLFLAASAAVNQNNLASAERLFARLATIGTGEDQAAAYLWVGRLALQRGDTATASSAFALSAQAAPEGYFSLRASDLQLNRVPFTPPASYAFDVDETALQQEAEDWLRQKFTITDPGSLAILSPLLQTDPRLIRGQELWALAAFSSAKTEFSDLVEAFKADGLASYQLAVYFRERGIYTSSIVAAANVIRAGGVSTLDAPEYLARMRYPIYYNDVVLPVSQQFGIDPLLLFSLIRHESLFDATATAAAGEKGLTQVIPSTGEYIAEQLGWPDYQHTDLFRPYAGVTFGAYYLSEQLNRFDRNAYAALAGYNAGPGRAYDWLALSNGDPDLFMEAITIDSTRLYVQRIYSSYNIYRALYGAGAL